MHTITFISHFQLSACVFCQRCQMGPNALVFWLQNRFYQQVQRMLPSALKFKEVVGISATQMTDNLNYRQLYLQCKQNVAIFMKQVDKEISNILKNHEEEKRKLQNEIQSLKQQLRSSKNDVSIVVRQNSSFKSIPPKNFSSELKERNHTSLSKQTMEQCLAKLSGFHLKSIVSQKRTSTKGSIVKERSYKAIQFKKNYKQEKESDCFTSQLSQDQQTENIDIEALRLITNLPKRRQKRLKEKASAKSEKVESIKDVLRSIRGKLNDQPRFFRAKEQEQRPVLTVITPEMFNVSKSLKK